MARNTGPAAATVKVVRQRDENRCMSCGVQDDSLTTQHRVARGMGGTRAAWINQPANLISLCGSGTTGCHGQVEAHPAAARESGMSVSRNGRRPEHVPVLTWRGWLLLTNDGQAIPVDEPPF